MSSIPIKLPPPPANPNERAEVEAFMLGFAIALRALNTFVTATEEKQKELFREATVLAKEFYPDFDPPPEPGTTHA